MSERAIDDQTAAMDWMTRGGPALTKRGQPVLELAGLTRHFRQGEHVLEVLRGVELTIQPGEMVALVGASGSGKSTLLQLAGLLEKPTGGTIRLAGRDVTHASDRERTRLRREMIGFVYQFHHLLPEFTALENLIYPQLLTGLSKRAARERATALLRAVGLGDRLKHRPQLLSGGEQQRVAIARALVNAPRLLLADEPTGNLDPRTSETVFALLQGLVQQAGLSALIVTHNLDLARRMDRVFWLYDGILHAAPKGG